MSTLYRVRSSIVASVTAATLVLAGVATVEMSGRSPAPVPAPALAAADTSMAAAPTVHVPAPERGMPATAFVQSQDDLELVGASIANYDR